MTTETGAALDALTALLRGEPAIVTDWTAVIALANQTWLSPQLYCALKRADRLDALPTDARDYLGLIHDSNLERNRRLRAQLLEAVAAFNGAGLCPTLLKGSVALFVPPEDGLGSRMTSDLDIGVEPHELQAARACLIDLGYEDIAEERGMGRPQDAGLVELRARSSSSALSGEQRALESETSVSEQAGLRVRIPSASCRALHWIAHDSIKEGDYWRGRIDLRHLHDVAQIEKQEGVDWGRLRTMMPGAFWENALATQLLSLNHFFAIPLPPELTFGRMARFQHWRRTVIAAHPIAGMPLRLGGNMVWGLRRIRMGAALASRGPTGLARRINRALLGANTGPKL
jgi:hypothetical protein